MSMKLYKEQNVQNIADAIRDRNGYERKNLFDKDNTTSGYLNLAGTIDANANYVVSDFIEVKSGEQYYIPVRGTTRTKYYKSDKSVYSNAWDVSDTAQVITIPNEVKYIRISIAIAGSTAIDINMFQFEQGTQATPYEPYDLKYKIRDMAAAIRELPSRTAYEKLLQNQIFETATGNPLFLEDSADMPFKKLEVQGNTEQESYLGRNKMPKILDGTYSQNGITINVTNGKFKITGTLSGGSFSHTFPFEKPFVVDKRYYFHIRNNEIQSSLAIGIDAHVVSPLNRIAQLNENIVGKTYTGFQVYCAAGTNINLTLEPSMEETNEITPYEPYVGGTASPNPEYPQEVKCVGQDVNLFDIKNAKIATWDSGIPERTQILEDGIVSTSNAYDWRSPSIDIPNLKQNTKYILSASCVTDAETIEIYIGAYDGNKVNTKRYSKTQGDISIVFDTETYQKIGISFNGGDSNISKRYTSIFTKIQITEGTEPLPYTPYGQGLASVKVQNRNLFNPNQEYQQGTYKYFQFTEQENKDYILSVKIKEGKTIPSGLYFGFTSKGDSVAGNNVKWIINNGVLSSNSTSNLIGGQYFKYISIYPKNIDVNEYFNIQLEEGTTATPYVEHAEQIFTIPVQQEMCAIGDVKDRFTKIGGKWFEEHNVGKIVLDGSEDWKLSSTGLGRFYIANLINFKLETSVMGFSPICSHFIGNNIAEFENKKIKLYYATDKFIRIENDDTSTLNEWKTWLSEHKPEVYYILATPQLIECTEEQSQILNKLQEALTYQGGTHVSATSENANPVLDVEYFVDIRPATMAMTLELNKEDYPVVEEKSSNFKLEEEEE